MAEIDFQEEPAIDFLSDEDALQSGFKATGQALGEVNRNLELGALAAPEPRGPAPIVPPTLAGVGQIPVAPPEVAARIIGAPLRAIGRVGQTALQTTRQVLDPTTYLPEAEQERLRPFVIDTRGGQIRPMTAPEAEARRPLAPERPLLPSPRTQLQPEGSDLGRLMEQWSTPEGITLLSTGNFSRLIGYTLLASMVPSLVEDAKTIASSNATPEDKRDRINNLAALAGMVVGHGVRGRPEVPFQSEEMAVPPPLPLTGAELIGRPRGATPLAPRAGPEVLGPPIPRRGLPVEVPETLPQPRESMVEEIKRRNLRTNDEIAEAFGIKREQAARLRRAVWDERQGPPLPPELQGPPLPQPGPITMRPEEITDEIRRRNLRSVDEVLDAMPRLRGQNQRQRAQQFLDRAWPSGPAPRPPAFDPDQVRQRLEEVRAPRMTQEDLNKLNEGDDEFLAQRRKVEEDAHAAARGILKDLTDDQLRQVMHPDNAERDTPLPAMPNGAVDFAAMEWHRRRRAEQPRVGELQGPQIPEEIQAQREREANMQREVEARRSALQQNIIFWERELEMARNRGDRRAQEEAAGQLMLFRRELEGIPPVKEILPKPPIARAPGRPFRPTVPGTPAEPQESVLAEIRRRKLRNKEAVLDAFPGMRDQPQAREKAADLLKRAWEVQGPPLPPEEPPPAAPPGPTVPKPPGAPPAAPSAAVPDLEIESPVEPGTPLGDVPQRIEDTVIAGKTLGEWENVRDASQLPRGTERAELAKWLAVPNQPSRILQALGNKKRTREIHAPPATEVTPVQPKALQAGGEGLEQVKPKIGDEVLTTHPQSGRLESIRYEGETGRRFDQFPIEKWTWLSGPDKGRTDEAYGRSFWKQAAEVAPVAAEAVSVTPTEGKAFPAQMSAKDFPPPASDQEPDLVLIACGKEKLETSTPVPAASLYTGPLFSARRGFAESQTRPWMILSALHGVIEPGREITPYDTVISELSPEDLKTWKDAVRAKVLEYFGGRQGTIGKTVELHGGNDYVKAFQAATEGLGISVIPATLGKGVGSQLAIYKQGYKRPLTIGSMASRATQGAPKPPQSEAPPATVATPEPPAPPAPGGGQAEDRPMGAVLDDLLPEDVKGLSKVTPAGVYVTPGLTKKQYDAMVIAADKAGFYSTGYTQKGKGPVYGEFVKKPTELERQIADLRRQIGNFESAQAGDIGLTIGGKKVTPEMAGEEIKKLKEQILRLDPIVSAAFRDRNTGQQFDTGPHHKWIQGMPTDQAEIKKLEQGFLTKSGKFLNRQQVEDLTKELPFAEDIIPHAGALGLEKGQFPPEAEPTATTPTEPPAAPAKAAGKAELDAMLDPNAIMRGKKPEGKMVKGTYETPPMTKEGLEAFQKQAEAAGWKYRGMNFFGATGIKWRTGAFTPPETAPAAPTPPPVATPEAPPVAPTVEAPPANQWIVRTPSGKRKTITIDPDKHQVVNGRVFEKATNRALGTIIRQAEPPVAPPPTPVTTTAPEPTATTETPGEQARGFDAKEAKQQKKFLLEHIDQAIADASDDPIGMWQNQQLEAENKIAQEYISSSVESRPPSPEKEMAVAKLQELFDKYQIPTEEPASEPYTDITGQRQQAEKGGSLKTSQRAALLQKAIQKANFEAAPKVTIEVPGDGTFTIVDSKPALQAFREQAASFPTTAPRPPQRSTSARVTPTAAPALGQLDKDNALRAAKLFGSKDPSRTVINYAYSDGKTTVATDGRRLIEINTGVAGTAKKPAFVKLHDKAKALEEDAKFPNYNQVIPTDASQTTIFSGLDAARMFNIVEQAKQALGEKVNSVNVYRNPDGSLGMTSGEPGIGEYSHNIKPGAKVVTALNADYLSDIFAAARILGDEKINLSTEFDRGETGLHPIVAKGKNFKAVLMPMRLNGQRANVLKSADIRGKPSMGPGAAASEEFEDPPPPSANVVGLDAGNRLVNEKVREWQNMVAGFRQLGLFSKTGRAAEKRDIQRAVDTMINLPRVWAQQAGNSFRLRLRNVGEQNAVTALMQSLKMSGQGLDEEALTRLEKDERFKQFIGDPIGYLRVNQTNMESLAQRYLNQGKKLEAGAAIDLAKGMAYAREHFAEFKSIAIEAKKRLDAQFARDAAAGVPVDYERWYVPQRHSIDLLPSADRPIVLGGGRGGGIGTPFRKAKVYEDYASAIEAGFVPRSLSIADLLEHRVLESERVIARKAMFESLKQVKDPVDGNPIATKIPRRTIKRPDGSIDIQESVPLNYEAFEVMPGVRLAIHRGYSRMLRAITGTSQISESAVVGAAQSLAAVEKHIGLALDTFHLVRVLMTELAMTGKVSLGPRLHRGVALVEYAAGDLNRAVQEGMITQEMADWATKPQPYEVNGRTVNLSPKALVNLALKNGLNIGRIADAIYKDWIRAIPLIGQVNKLVFDKISRSSMIYGFMSEFGRVAKNHPEWDANKVAATVGSDINVLFGNLQKESWVQSPSLNAIAKIVMLAPQWVESLIRREGRGAFQLGEAGVRLAQGKSPNLGTAGKTMGTGLLAYLVGTQILNLITRGHLTFQNPEPEHKLDAYVPDPFSTGKGFFISPLSVFGEITHDILRYAQTKPDIATALTQIGANKLGNLGRAIGVAMLGRDPLTSEKIIGTWHRAAAAGAQAIPVPIIASGAARMLGAAVLPDPLIKGMGVQRPTGSDIERQVASSFGFKVEPAPSAQGEIRRLVDKWKMTQEPKLQADVERRQKEEFRSSYADLRSALNREDMQQAQRAYRELRQEGSTPEQIRKTIEHPHPFAGSKVLENRFYDSLTQEQQKLYEEALKERDTAADRLEKLLDKAPQLEE